MYRFSHPFPSPPFGPSPAIPPLYTLCALQVDWDAVAHYKVLFERVRARGLRVMCTLFHHSFPKWGLPGGWKEEKAVRHFAMFAE